MKHVLVLACMFLFAVSVTCIHTFIEYKKQVEFNNVLREVVLSNIDLNREQFVSKVNYILDTEKDEKVVRAYIYLYDLGFEGVETTQVNSNEIVERIASRLSNY